MTDLATQVAGLSTSVNALTSAVNVARSTLDASVAAAGSSAATAQAAVTSAASSANTAQNAQAAAVAVSGLSNLNSFLGQIQAGAPAAVFWYDTTRDSDGGAWRKRCTWQSWMTEAASSTRGSRLSFPAQALIVATSTAITIYDADQATAAMWMVFNTGGTALASYNMAQAPQAIFARDGRLWVAGGGYGLIEVDFISDRALLTTATASLAYAAGVSSRNTGAGYLTPTGRGVLTNAVTSSVAATVLPGAPIDRATGLPRPTVAVGTAFYLDVIYPSGVVTYPSSSAVVTSLAFDVDGVLYAGDGTTVRVYHPASLAVTGFSPIRSETVSSVPALLGAPTGVTGIATRSTSGLTLRAPDAVNPAGGMVAYITAAGGSSAGGGAFNSGWLVGDVRLALSSTSTASATASGELISNGTFASTTGWTAYQSATLSTSNNTLTITNGAASNGIAYQMLATVVGQTYLVTVDSAGGTSTVAIVSAGSAINNNDLGQIAASSTATGITLQFTAKTATTYLNLVCDNVSGHTVSFKNCSVQLAEPDRSTKAIGMRVVGTLTKALVASTADLSAWGGFGTANYLVQPYEAIHDYGTGDHSGAVWVNPTAVNSAQAWVARDGATTGARIVAGMTSAGLPFVTISDGTNTVTVTAAAALLTGVWSQIIWARRSGTLELWVNGVRVATASVSAVGSVSNAAASLYVGVTAQATNPASGSLTLVRLSATAPTPEQIARMYADERPLFQPGAKCVLGGTTAPVQGLAHDPDVGALYAAKSDGTSVFQGLIRTAHLTGLAASGNSDNHSVVSARQGGYVIATANQTVASQPAITFRDRLLADRMAIPPADPNRVVFPAIATTDVTPTVIARLPLAEGDELQLFVDVEAAEVGAAPTERMGYQRRARVYRLPNGNVTVAAVQALGTDYESATTTCDVTVVADTASQTVCVQATGVAAKRLSWSTLAHVNRAGQTRYAIAI